MATIGRGSCPSSLRYLSVQQFPVSAAKPAERTILTVPRIIGSGRMWDCCTSCKSKPFLQFVHAATTSRAWWRPPGRSAGHRASPPSQAAQHIAGADTSCRCPDVGRCTGPVSKSSAGFHRRLGENKAIFPELWLVMAHRVDVFLGQTRRYIRRSFSRLEAVTTRCAVPRLRNAVQGRTCRRRHNARCRIRTGGSRAGAIQRLA